MPDILEQPIGNENRADVGLKLVGLAPKDLVGKRVLDLGAGGREIERQLRHRKVDCDIVSLDIDRKTMMKGRGNKRNAVQADAFSGLPFRDESFDLMVSIGGPYNGGPWDEVALLQFDEALRILKPGGEMRSSVAFWGTGGIGTLLYHMAKNGEFDIPGNFIKDFKEYDYDNDRFQETTKDENGIPLDFESGFWIDAAYKFLPKTEQEEMYRYIGKTLQNTLTTEASHPTITLTERYDTVGTKNYIPYFVMKK